MSGLVRQYRYTDPRGGLVSSSQSGLTTLAEAAAEGIQSPAMATLGMRLTAAEKGEVEVVCKAEDFLANHFGVLHGGAAAALLDTAMSGAAHSVIPEDAGYTTVELSVRYVRPITLDGGDIRCRGRVLQAGRRLVFTNGDVRDQSGKMVAHGAATLMVVDGS